MNTDSKLLHGVSKYFNKETLKNIVAKEKSVDPETVEILGWDFGSACAKGDSQLSVVHRVKVKSKISKQSKNEEIETNYVIKSIPKNAARKKMFRSDEFFYNEITFYNEVVIPD